MVVQVGGSGDASAFIRASESAEKVAQLQPNPQAGVLLRLAKHVRYCAVSWLNNFPTSPDSMALGGMGGKGMEGGWRGVGGELVGN